MFYCMGEGRQRQRLRVEDSTGHGEDNIQLEIFESREKTTQENTLSRHIHMCSTTKGKGKMNK